MVLGSRVQDFPKLFSFNGNKVIFFLFSTFYNHGVHAFERCQDKWSSICFLLHNVVFLIFRLFLTLHCTQIVSWDILLLQRVVCLSIHKSHKQNSRDRPLNTFSRNILSWASFYLCFVRTFAMIVALMLERGEIQSRIGHPSVARTECKIRIYDFKFVVFQMHICRKTATQGLAIFDLFFGFESLEEDNNQNKTKGRIERDQTGLSIRWWEAAVWTHHGSDCARACSERCQ